MSSMEGYNPGAPVIRGRGWFVGIPMGGAFVPHSNPELAQLGAVEWVDYADEDTVLEQCSLDTEME